MHNQLEEDLFELIATTHVSTDGVIRVSSRGFQWCAYKQTNKELISGDGPQFEIIVKQGDENPSGTSYGTAKSAVHAFVQRFYLLGQRSDHPGILSPLDNVEFCFSDHHPNVAVTWRHLKARFKGIKLILSGDRKIMEEIIEEAASM